MKITVQVPRTTPWAEPDLLVRFVMRQLSATNEPDSTEPSPVLLALSLAAVSHDEKFHDRLKEQVTSSSGEADEILGMSRDLFLPTLGQRDKENPFPNERNCKQVLLCALSEGKRILAEKDFEFLRVFEFLTLAGLICYSFRLAQFEDVCDSFQDDPEDLVRQGTEIIETITFSPRNEN